MTKSLDQLKISCENITGKPDVSLLATLDVYRSFYDYFNDNKSLNEISKYLLENGFTKNFNDYINKYIKFIIENDFSKKCDDIYHILNVSLTLLVNFSFSNDEICNEISLSNLMITFDEYLRESSYFIKKISDDKCFGIVYDMLSVITNLGAINGIRLDIKKSILKILENISNLPTRQRNKMKFICLEVYFNYELSANHHKQEMVDNFIVKYVDQEILDLLLSYIESGGSNDDDSKYFSKVELLQFMCEIYKCGVNGLSKEQLEDVKNKLKDDDQYKSKIDELLKKDIKLENMSLDDKIKLNHPNLDKNIKLENMSLDDKIKLNHPNLDKDKFHVFLSYSHDNRDDVNKVYNRLVERGLKVWIDYKCMPSGCDTFDAMCEGIENSITFVCALSDSYQNSENCLKELNHGFKEGKPMFPFKVKSCSLDKKVDRRLGSYNRAKLHDILNNSNFADDIINCCNEQ